MRGCEISGSLNQGGRLYTTYVRIRHLCNFYLQLFLRVRTSIPEGKQPNDIRVLEVCLSRSSSSSCARVHIFSPSRKENAQGRTPYDTEDSGTLERDGAMATSDSTGRGERRMVNLWRRQDAAGILHTPMPGSESPALVRSESQVPIKQ